MDKRTENRKIGDIGEQVACEWLENRGFSITQRNYLKPWGEIDIVAEKGKRIFFVEVKTVSRENITDTSEDISRENSDHRPEDNVHPEKLKRLGRAIQSYLVEKNIEDSKEWQLEVITVYLDQAQKKAKVECLSNVIIGS